MNKLHFWLWRILDMATLGCGGIGGPWLWRTEFQPISHYVPLRTSDQARQGRGLFCNCVWRLS